MLVRGTSQRRKNHSLEQNSKNPVNNNNKKKERYRSKFMTKGKTCYGCGKMADFIKVVTNIN